MNVARTLCYHALGAFPETPSMSAMRYTTLLTVLLCAAIASHAQEQPAPAAALLTAADIDERVARVEADASLDANIKARVLETYAQALPEIQAAEQWRRRRDESTALRTTAPDTILELQARATEPFPAPAAPPEPESTSLDALVGMLAEAERRIDESNAAVAALEQQSDERTARRTQLDGLIAEARDAIERTRATAVPPPEAHPEEVEALRIYTLARTQALEAEIAAYNEELNSFEIRGRLLALQEDVARRELEIAKRNTEPLRALVARERLNDAQKALVDAEQALQEAADAPANLRPTLVQIATENVELARRRAAEDGPGTKLDKTLNEARAKEAEIERIHGAYQRLERREKAIGLTEEVGKMLRAYRANLTPRQTLTTNLGLRKREVGAALLEQIELQEARREFSMIAVDQRIEEILAIATSDPGFAPSDEQIGRLRNALGALLTTQAKLLADLSGDHDNYVNALLALNEREKQLLVQRDDFEDYINQRVLWISSGEIVSLDDLRDAVNVMAWITEWSKWADVARALVNDLLRNPLPNGIAIVLALAIGLAYPRIRTRLVALADKAEKRTATNYLWTLETLLYSVILAAIGPLVTFYFGWRLGSSLTAGEFTRNLGAALKDVAAIYASLEVPRQFLRARGLGEIHFDWLPEATAAARRALAWTLAAGLPILLFIAIIEEAPESADWRESVGRIAFTALMLIWASLGHQLTKRDAPSIMIFLPLSIPGQRDRVRRILYLLSAGAPVGFAVAAVLGYFDTAQRLALRVHITLVFVFAVSVGVGLVMRAFLVTRRGLAFEQAKKKRAELREAQKKAAEGGEVSPTSDFQEPEIDLAQVDTQTRRLTRSSAIIALAVGCWLIWVDFIPALRVLDEITIGQTTAPIRAAAVADLPLVGGTTGPTPEAGVADAEPATSTTPSAELPSGSAIVGAVEALTIADLLATAIVLMLTISAARNLPGLLEIALLQRLSLAAGERYAIKTVLGYIIGAVGAIVALSILGIRWERMQWLVAALGLGIGFGLQEIVANFISGLIILFERPVRLGDTVTVGNVSGTVSRIQIRATTITDWDRKDLIVPNKEFVTGQVVNWSLTDPIIRTTISLGVDYGSDTRKVRDILARVANTNSHVLKDPPPVVSFSEFGASTLNFDLRVFVAGVTEILACRDELHHAINDALREAGIEIAFNQTDVHIRSVPPSLTLGGTPVPKELERQ